MAISALAALLLVQTSRAGTECWTANGDTVCESQVALEAFMQQAYDDQDQSQWCWAASISMLFDYSGHPVSQLRIVEEAYGSTVNMGAMGITIAQQLNRDWMDDFGEPFHSTLTGAYDADAGVYAITNQQIVNELDADRPLIIGNTSHAMVMTYVQWIERPTGPEVILVGVVDPWPGNGAHYLPYEEFVPIEYGGELRFLATARITDGAAGYPDGDTGYAWDPPADGDCDCASGPGATVPGAGAGVVLALAALRRRARRTGS